MQKLKWRPRAAVVGYIDVILALIGIIGTIVSAVAIAVHDHNIQAKIKQPAERTSKPEPTEEPVNKTEPGYDPQSPVRGDFIVSLPIIWAAVGVAALFTASQLVAAVRMLKATEANYDPKNAICPSQCWLIINTTMLLFSCPVYVFIWGKLGSAGYCGGLIIRVIMIYVVYKYMKELMEVTAGFSSKIVSNRNKIGPK